MALLHLTESSLALLALSITGVAYLWALISKYNARSHKLPHPPGPEPKDVLSGNRSEISTSQVWCKYKDWAKQYGSVLYVRVFGKPILVINSLDDAVELFERRSRIYSSRPVVPMYELMGFNTGTAMRAYGPEWRRHRRIFQQTFKPDSALAYRPTQTKKMLDLLYGLVTTPEDYQGHLYTFGGAVILSVMYGYNVAPKDDHFVRLVESSRPDFSLGPSHTWLVNSFPLLSYIPSWFPGAGFKRYANSVKQKLVEQREAPFKYALKSSVSGATQASVVSNLIDSCQSETDIRLLQEAAASGYAAGVGTTVSSILVFIVAMITYPEIQKKAQEHVDRVTGGDRLPDYNDQASLPYIQAIIRETLRWKPLLPLGIPHSTSEDDVYKGYLIPKDSAIHPNVWAMTRDPDRYEDPERFNPDRFFDEDGELNNDDVGYVFGFGRRLCPGRHLGTASVWLAITSILANFNLEAKKDASGNPLPLDVKYAVNGVSSYPLGFECTITPRSEKNRKIILEAREKA